MVSRSCASRSSGASIMSAAAMMTMLILNASWSNAVASSTAPFLRTQTTGKKMPVFDKPNNGKYRPQRKQLEKMNQEQILNAQRQIESQFESSQQHRHFEDPEEESHEEQRKAFSAFSWFGGNSGPKLYFPDDYNPYEEVIIDSVETYNKWQQAFRMLGAYIDCDHPKHEADDHHDSKEDDDGRSTIHKGCSRWMVWASYIDPNYQGGGYDEYRGDSPTGTLDCDQSGTSWQLLGVYRQEFYQHLEQMSKHLWGIKDERYITALAGLSYMTDTDCIEMGDGLYAGIEPLSGGYFQMSMYSDQQCIVLDESGATYDDYGATTTMDLNCDSDDYANDDNGNDDNGNDDNGNVDKYYNRYKGSGAYGTCGAFKTKYYYNTNSNNDDNGNDDNGNDDNGNDDNGNDDNGNDDNGNDDNGNDDNGNDDNGNDDNNNRYLERNLSNNWGAAAKISEALSIWSAAQEYTLTKMNAVYDDFKSCTPCMDYPTYQDGFFIGDYGTDDDYLINQCWKFHSHDSFTCGANCVDMAAAQGSVLSFDYAGANQFGNDAVSISSSRHSLMAYEREGEVANYFFLGSAMLCLIATAVFVKKGGWEKLMDYRKNPQEYPDMKMKGCANECGGEDDVYDGETAYWEKDTGGEVVADVSLMDDDSIATDTSYRLAPVPILKTPSTKPSKKPSTRGRSTGPRGPPRDRSMNTSLLEGTPAKGGYANVPIYSPANSPEDGYTPPVSPDDFSPEDGYTPPVSPDEKTGLNPNSNLNNKFDQFVNDDLTAVNRALSADPNKGDNDNESNTLPSDEKKGDKSDIKVESRINDIDYFMNEYSDANLSRGYSRSREPPTFRGSSRSREPPTFRGNRPPPATIDTYDDDTVSQPSLSSFQPSVPDSTEDKTIEPMSTVSIDTPPRTDPEAEWGVAKEEEVEKKSLDYYLKLYEPDN